MIHEGVGTITNKESSEMEGVMQKRRQCETILMRLRPLQLSLCSDYPDNDHQRRGNNLIPHEEHSG